MAKAKSTKKERLEKLDEILDIKDSKTVVDETDIALSSVTKPRAFPATAPLYLVLDLAAVSPIDMILYSKDSLVTAEERFEGVRLAVQKEIAPHLDQYLKGLNAAEELKKVTTLEQLSQVIFIYIPLDFKQKLAAFIDNITGFELYQKVWIFDTFVNMFANGAEKQIEPVFQKRMQEIMNAKRIIKV